MTPSVVGFHFSDEGPGTPAEGRYVLSIPAGITRRRQLFRVYARGLAFPAYFGGNWDAFEECLSDLGWLTDAREFVLWHADVPFSAGDHNRRVYLDILRGWTSDPLAEASRVARRVIFPTCCRTAVREGLARN